MTSNKKLHKALRLALVAVLLAPCGAGAADASYELGGHTKGRLLGQVFPDNSALQAIAGSSTLDVEGDLRLNFTASQGRWSFAADYQLFSGYGDFVNAPAAVPGIDLPRLPNDDRRLFNLTGALDDSGKFVAMQRFDRLWAGYAGDKAVVRLGRQALSWGNGLIFSPMDIVNPFDPAAVDTEYKSGDDMLYGQFLLDDGNDIQAAYVVRRDIVSGDPEFTESTVAIKYHAIAGDAEYEFLVAQNYGDTALAIGGNRSIGGAIWRGDAVITETTAGNKLQFVTNLSYSWLWRGHNVSGVVEYFFDGFGIRNGRYDAAALARNPALRERLARGQSFTIGRHYVAAGATIEMTPLWNLAPTIFANADDNSALLQIVTRHNLDENMEFTGALNLPLGPDGSEYGGIELDLPGTYLSSDASLFAQFAWYF